MRCISCRSRPASAASMVDVAHAEIAGHVNVTGRRSGSPTRNVPVRDETLSGAGSIADAAVNSTAHVSRPWIAGLSAGRSYGASAGVRSVAVRSRTTPARDQISIGGRRPETWPIGRRRGWSHVPRRRASQVHASRAGSHRVATATGIAACLGPAWSMISASGPACSDERGRVTAK